MKLEVGKYYRTRDGEKVGPMRADPRGRARGFEWADEHDWAWRADGTFDIRRLECDEDLIAEWVDEPAAPQPAGPVRTITRKEVVPGTYGDVFVDEDGDVRVGYMSDAADIRAAIATLSEIADAMEENSK